MENEAKNGEIGSSEAQNAGAQPVTQPQTAPASDPTPTPSAQPNPTPTPEQPSAPVAPWQQQSDQTPGTTWPQPNQAPNAPEAPNQPPAPQPQPQQPQPGPMPYAPNRTMPRQMIDPDGYEVTRARNLLLIANVAGPVSLIFGGMLLSTVGFVCAAMGFRKLSKLIERNSSMSDIAIRMKRASIISMSICGVAFGLNAVSAYMMFPEIMNMVNSMDSAGSLGANAGAGSSGSTNTWG